MIELKRSPLPWRHKTDKNGIIYIYYLTDDGDELIIVDDVTLIDARFIVRAVNEFDEMVEILADHPALLIPSANGARVRRLLARLEVDDEG